MHGQDVLVNNAGVGDQALAGTGVLATQVCPGPVESDFDKVAGTEGGIAGGPPQFLRISAARCAKDALASLERGAALVVPGRAYRIAMALLPLVPRRVQRARGARASARPRRPDDATDPHQV